MDFKINTNIFFIVTCSNIFLLLFSSCIGFKQSKLNLDIPTPTNECFITEEFIHNNNLTINLKNYPYGLDCQFIEKKDTQSDYDKFAQLLGLPYRYEKFSDIDVFINKVKYGTIEGKQTINVLTNGTKFCQVAYLVGLFYFNIPFFIIDEYINIFRGTKKSYLVIKPSNKYIPFNENMLISIGKCDENTNLIALRHVYQNASLSQKYFIFKDKNDFIEYEIGSKFFSETQNVLSFLNEKSDDNLWIATYNYFEKLKYSEKNYAIIKEIFLGNNGLHYLKLYIDSFPNGIFSDYALFEYAKIINTINSYENYLYKKPNGKYTQVANEKIEDIFFQKVVNEDSITSYLNYKKRYPDGKYFNKSVLRINAINDWNRIKKSNDPELLKNYIYKYPNAKENEEANYKISYINAIQSMDINKIDKLIIQYKEYINNEDEKLIINHIKKIVHNNETALGYIILYSLTDDIDFFQKGYRLPHNTLKEESYYVQKKPNEYFVYNLRDKSLKGQQKNVLNNVQDSLSNQNAGDAFMGVINNLYFPKSMSKTKPIFDIPIYSNALIGTYKVHIKFTLKVKIETEYQTFGKYDGSNTKYETYTTEQYFVVPPKSYITKKIEFKPITTHKSSSFLLIAGSETKTKLVNLDTNIVSATLIK